MGRIRSAVTAALDGVIGGLSTVRGRVADDDDDQMRPADPTLPASADPTADDPAEDPATEGLPSIPGATDLATATDGDEGAGVGGRIRDAVSSTVVYEATVLRHPVAAQVEHLSSLREAAGLDPRFLDELFLVTSDARRRRVERIRQRTGDDRSVTEDAREFAGNVDWGRTWLYGKVGYKAGRRYGERLPVADEYAPIAGAVAGGAYGAVTTATDRTLVDADPDRLFDRIDALARLRDDPVTRASVARQAISEVDRRIASEDDPLPVEDVVSDEDVARAVTTEDEAVPDEVRIDPATRDLLTRDFERALPARDRVPVDLPADGDPDEATDGEGDGPSTTADSRSEGEGGSETVANSEADDAGTGADSAVDDDAGTIADADANDGSETVDETER